MSTLIPKVSKVSNLVWRILGCNPSPLTLQGTNIYLVGNGPKRILIDAGDAGFSEYVSNITDLLKKENASVEHLIITHWHHDHIGALPELEPVLCEKDPPCVYKFPRTDEQDGPIPNKFKFKHLTNSQIFKTDGATLKVIFTPGHTTDHAVLFLNEEASLFSGDCILGEGTAVFEDLFNYMKSLEKILEQKPLKIYPGHGPIIESPIEKIQYYINHRNEREAQILNYLQTHTSSKSHSATPMDIVRAIYKETPEHLYPAAEFNVSHHLNKLLKENKICQDGDDRYYVELNASL